MFLSVYVDDLKLAGRAEAVAPMWKTLGKILDLDPPTEMSGSVYLGCGQHNFQPAFSNIEEKSKLFQRISSNETDNISKRGELPAVQRRVTSCRKNYPTTPILVHLSNSRKLSGG